MWKYIVVFLIWSGERAGVYAQEQSPEEFYADLSPENKTLLSTSSNEVNTESIFLPKTLVPEHYLVRLQPFINGNFSFNGYVEINFSVAEQTNKIVLHISDIVTKNDTVKVYEASNEETGVAIELQEYDHEKNFYVITLTDDLSEGKNYVLSLDFEGFLNEDLKGFYRSSYKDDDGNTKYLATTQFQPTDARKAFPCFDEPDFKAKFTIEMIREDGMTTISNMPLAETVPAQGHEGWFLDRFNTSFPMSTYLVAFIVSDFEFIEAEGADEYRFRVYARKNAISSAKYAVELGPKVSKFYEEFFGVKFPLPKQDMAAVPDFSAGAMENWGLIIYRESSFLYDSELAKAEDKMRIASIISHELAHQWFGNLVTPVWWTDLWLNEGFASYMEYIGLRDTEPTLRPLDQFIVVDLHKAFALDCLESSHPISIPVNNPDEINSIFDAISYSKGASIIRMMSSYLTEETFKSGLSNYLTELSYQNAEQEDLWEYLTVQGHEDGTLDSNMTVKEIMDTWTLQMGYPVITVLRNSDGTATISQERFLLSTTNTTNDTHNYKWWIPLTFTTQPEMTFDEITPKAWISPDEAVKIIPGMPSDDEWVIFNTMQTGYYRVNYDEANWESIVAQLLKDPTVFPDANRAQLIDDSLNLARSGELSYGIVLDLLKYLKNEREFVPIMAALKNLDYIKSMLTFSGGYGYFKNYLESLIIPLYKEVNFSDSLSDPHLEQRKRELITKWACDLGHYPCIKATQELFAKWMKSPEDTRIISPNLKSVVYCSAIKEGGPKEWKFAWEKYLMTHVGTEQKELLEALACTHDVWILGEYLNRSVTPNQGIKKQMLRYIIPAVARNSIGKVVAWQFLRDRWDDILTYLGSVSFVLDEIVGSVTKSLNTEVQMDEMKQFIKKYEGNFASATRAVKQAAENLMNNRNWMTNYYDVILGWLQKNGYQSEI